MEAKNPQNGILNLKKRKISSWRWKMQKPVKSIFGGEERSREVAKSIGSKEFEKWRLENFKKSEIVSEILFHLRRSFQDFFPSPSCGRVERDIRKQQNIPNGNFALKFQKSWKFSKNDVCSLVGEQFQSVDLLKKKNSRKMKEKREIFCSIRSKNRQIPF